MSPKNVTNVVWYILVQLRSLQAAGDWSLAACLWVGQQQACDEPFGREPFGRELRVERLRVERLRVERLSRVEASSQ